MDTTDCATVNKESPTLLLQKRTVSHVAMERWAKW